jgi:hypothetical protein
VAERTSFQWARSGRIEFADAGVEFPLGGKVGMRPSQANVIRVQLAHLRTSGEEPTQENSAGTRRRLPARTSVLIGPKRMFLRSTSSAIASASTKSFLFGFTNGFTNCAAINRTSCPCFYSTGKPGLNYLRSALTNASTYLLESGATLSKYTSQVYRSLLSPFSSLIVDLNLNRLPNLSVLSSSQ